MIYYDPHTQKTKKDGIKNIRSSVDSLKIDS